MSHLTKNLLIVSLLALGVGLALTIGVFHVAPPVAFYVLLPLGAVFFGLYMIFRTLENEARAFDAEQRKWPQQAPAPAARPCCCESRLPEPQTAKSH